MKKPRLSANLVFCCALCFVAVVVNIVLAVVYDYPLLDLLASVTGILFIAFLAERSIISFAFGWINVVLYIIVCWQTKLFGEVIFYGIDFVIQIPAFFAWRKAMQQNKEEPLKVRSRKLKPIYYFVLPVGIGIFGFAYGLLLKIIGGEYYFIDAVSSGVTVVATLLQWWQFREQWIGWIFVYVVSIILWVMAGNILMIVMSAGCLLFTLKGFFEWWRNSKKVS